MSSFSNSVFEFYTVDDFRQLVLTAQSPPGLRRRHHQFEHHETRGILRQRALHADGAMPHRREHALDRIRGSQMVPMIRGEVEERQQGRTILDQAFDGLVVFGRVFFGECRRRRFTAARFGDSQISRRSLCALGCIDFGSLSSTLSVLCSQHR